MKYLITALAFVFATNVFAEAEMKKVCQVDEKTKKEVCKTIKTHKKAEKVTTGDPTAPEAKPAKKK
jgi:hypothetical protein